MRPVSSYPEQRSAKTAISHACRIAIDYISIDPHSRHSIRSDPYLSTSRRADKARSIADFCCSSRATMPWSPPANSDRFQGDALTLVF